MNKVLDTRLSYSSAGLLKNCSQKYYYYKVKGCAKDPDSEDNETAFNIGKAFHWIMEENNHTEEKLSQLLDQAVKAFEVEEHKALLHAMLLRYLQCHQSSGLKAVGCELTLSSDDFIGFVDVVLADEEGNWWIGDLKTATRHSDILGARLHFDNQLNLYASFASEVAVNLDLDIKKFKGCRYRVTTKSTIKRKATEGYNDYVKRLAGTVKSYDYVIPIEKMTPKEIMKEHKKLHAKSMRLRKGTLKPDKNTSYCDSFFRPCEYWSQCYGDTYTNLKDKLDVVTSNNV